MLDDSEISIAATPTGDGALRLEVSVPGIHCGGCIRTIEAALTALPGVLSARVNLSARRVAVCFRSEEKPPHIGGTLSRLGFEAHLCSPLSRPADRTLNRLLRALAFAGFAAMNIMMMSVAVWAGADGESRQAFHWASAAIALPALAYSGQVFFRSAWGAVRRGRTNMDVPISVGLVVTYAMSAYDTMRGGEHAYFDAAASLLFFLLIGRTLDHMMRARARAAIAGLEKLMPVSADIVEADGHTRATPVEEVTPGTRLQVAVGRRIPVNGVVDQGASDVDVSLISGESAPEPVRAGDHVLSGALNLTGPLRIVATATAERSFLADMICLVRQAEGERGRRRRLADRIAALYSPVVHVAAALAFIYWVAQTGDAHLALTIAVSVLIITCPCALALAAPMVQVRASAALLEAGVLMKDGAALERIDEIDAIVFDKTGTLTTALPELTSAARIDSDHLRIAAMLASASHHPQARAIIAQARRRNLEAPTSGRRREIPGCGVEAEIGPHIYRLGRADWALRRNGHDHPPEAAWTLLTRDGDALERFEFEEQLKPDAETLVAALRSAGYAVEMLSGDSAARVRKVAGALGLTCYQAQLRPDEKLQRLDALSEDGRKTLMVGDGVNDAPALAKAHVSLAPSTASDIGRNAADFVVTRSDMASIATVIRVAKRARRLSRQNIAFAIIYNIAAVPFAFAGFVTPLFAAIAMSSSSLIVVANAMRLSKASIRDNVRDIGA